MTKNVVRIAIAVVGLAIVAAAAWYWQRPAYVAERAVTSLAKARTARFVAVLQLENATATEQVLGERGEVELKLDGVFARGADETKKDALQAGVVLGTKTESITVNVEGDVRFVDDKAYLFIKKAPPLFSVLAQLKGQWLTFARQGEVGESATRGSGVFTEVDRAGVEELNGEQVVTYTAVATDTAVIRMMDGIAAVLGTRLTDQQVADIRTSVARAERVPVELKIKRGGRQLRELATMLTIPGGNTVRFTLTILDINQPVDITPPEGAVPIEDAVRKLQQG